MAGEGRGGKSGEFAALAEIADKIYQRVDERVSTIVENFEIHAKDVTGQLAAGDKTMALINQSVQAVKQDVAELSTKVENNSNVVNQMKVDAQNFRRRGDTSPLSTAALEPKADPAKPGFVAETGKMALSACVSALAVAVMLWIMRGNAASIVNAPPAPTPAAAPTTPP